MTAKVRVELCDECVHDGGIHYADDGTWSRPHLDAARAKADAHRAVELAHAEQTKTARRIIRDCAARCLEFNANMIRTDMDAAGVSGPVVGAAFTYAETQGWIEATGRTVPSTEATTRHRINVWRSLVWNERRASA